MGSASRFSTDGSSVVTDGFYEWKKLDAKGKLKQPYAIAMADDDAQMVMAALWAKWK